MKCPKPATTERFTDLGKLNLVKLAPGTFHMLRILSRKMSKFLIDIVYIRRYKLEQLNKPSCTII